MSGANEQDVANYDVMLENVRVYEGPCEAQRAEVRQELHHLITSGGWAVGQITINNHRGCSTRAFVRPWFFSYRLQFTKAKTKSLSFIINYCKYYIYYM